MLDVSNPMCFWSTLFHFNVNGRRSEITRSKIEKIMPRTNEGRERVQMLHAHNNPLSVKNDDIIRVNFSFSSLNPELNKI